MQTGGHRLDRSRRRSAAPGDHPGRWPLRHRPGLHRGVHQHLARPRRCMAVGGPMVQIDLRASGHVRQGRSRAGVGHASHRFADYEGYGESVVPLPFSRVGTRTSAISMSSWCATGDELNFRQAGGKIYIWPAIRFYYVHELAGVTFRQLLQYAFWRIPMLRKHRRPTTVRQVAPPLFFLAIAGLMALGATLRRPLVASRCRLRTWPPWPRSGGALARSSTPARPAGAAGGRDPAHELRGRVGEEGPTRTGLR